MVQVEGNVLNRIHGSGFLRFECLSLVDLSINLGGVRFIECRVEVLIRILCINGNNRYNRLY